MDQLVNDWNQIVDEFGLHPKPSSDHLMLNLFTAGTVSIKDGWTMDRLREIADVIKENDENDYVRTWLTLDGTIEHPLVTFKAEYTSGTLRVPKVGDAFPGNGVVNWVRHEVENGKKVQWEFKFRVKDGKVEHIGLH